MLTNKHLLMNRTMAVCCEELHLNVDWREVISQSQEFYVFISVTAGRKINWTLVPVTSAKPHTIPRKKKPYFLPFAVYFQGYFRLWPFSEYDLCDLKHPSASLVCRDGNVILSKYNTSLIIDACWIMKCKPEMLTERVVTGRSCCDHDSDR